MRRQTYLMVLAVILAGVYLPGCSGLSQQYRATTEGMKIVYAPKVEGNIPKTSLNLIIIDERINKDTIGDGAKRNLGQGMLATIMGGVPGGLLYLILPDTPPIKADMAELFLKAYAERLTTNGIKLSNDNSTGNELTIYIRDFNLDFNVSIWTGAVGYTAKLQKNSELLCEQSIYEKKTKWNTYGYGSGETAISDAFNSAINNFDIGTCLSKK